MPIATVKELIEAGVHFGHPVSRWHPRMEPYIFGKRNGIHIIDLRKTVAAMVEAAAFLRKTVRSGGRVLFVGTKRQAKDVVRAEAQRVGMPFVSERWLGGTLTNLSTIRQQIRRLENIERIEQSGELERYSKKALAAFRREKRRVVRNLEGIRTMTEPPQALLIVDPSTEHNAVKEAKKLRIPVVAVLDTDADPKPIDIPIPANDDAIRSVELILSRLADAIEKGLEEKSGVQPVKTDFTKGFSTAELAAVAAEESSSEPAENAAPGDASPEQPAGAAEPETNNG